MSSNTRTLNVVMAFLRGHDWWRGHYTWRILCSVDRVPWYDPCTQPTWFTIIFHVFLFLFSTCFGCRPGSSFAIATELRAGRSWDRIPVGTRFSAPVQTGPGAHPASCTMGTGSFSGVKCGRGVLLTTHPLLVPRSWKSRAIPLPSFWTTTAL